jgi:hypothetical protein
MREERASELHLEARGLTSPKVYASEHVASAELSIGPDLLLIELLQHGEMSPIYGTPPVVPSTPAPTILKYDID